MGEDWAHPIREFSFRALLSNKAQRSENGDVELGGSEGKQKKSPPKAFKKVTSRKENWSSTDKRV